MPSGSGWPARPQWGNFVRAFEVSTWPSSSPRAPSSWRRGADRPVRSRPCAPSRRPSPDTGSRSSRAIRARAHLPSAGSSCPVLPGALDGIYNTRLAIVLPLIGLTCLRGVLDARPLRQMSPRSPRRPTRRRHDLDLFWRIHLPLARAPISPSEYSCLSGPGINSCSPGPRRGSFSPDNGGRPRAFQGHSRDQRSASLRGNHTDPRADLLVFVLFQRKSYGPPPGRRQG